MNNHAQSALEYLMTYGWALIVIAVIVGLIVVVLTSVTQGGVTCATNTTNDKNAFLKPFQCFLERSRLYLRSKKRILLPGLNLDRSISRQSLRKTYQCLEKVFCWLKLTEVLIQNQTLL